MPYSHQHVPVYRHKKSRGVAVVTLNGRDIYLGKFNSTESLHKYDKLIQEWLASGRVLTSENPIDEEAFSVAELIVAYMKHAKVYYQKDEKPTSHLHNVEDAMTYLKNLYGLEAVKDFGPLKLKAVRQQMIGKGLGRTTINKYIDNLKRMFKWGTENELVPSSVFHGLQAISGLRKGRCEAKEYPPVKPVAEAFIEAIKDHVSKQVWAMIQLQVFTGMRPGEVVLMRGQDIDITGKLWVYTPQHHKTEHHGISRPIYLGPKAQEIVEKFMKPELAAYLLNRVMRWKSSLLKKEGNARHR